MESYIICMTDVHRVIFYVMVVAGRAVTGGVGEFAAVGECKSTIVEFYILNVVVLFALHPQKLGAAGPDIGKINVPNGIDSNVGMFRYIKIYGSTVNFVHDDIIKSKIFHMGSFSADVGRTGTGFTGDDVGEIEINSAGAVGHNKIGEGTVANHTVIDPTDTNTGGIAGEITVGDGDPLADLIFCQ